MPLRQSDLENSRSLGDFINDFADLSEQSTKEIYTHITELLENSQPLQESDHSLFWNFSVNKLIYDVIDSYKSYASFKEDGIIHWDGKEFHISDIVHADAGNAFNYDLEHDIVINELVVPWKNQNLATFKEVMRDQFCVSINNNKKTQFTRTRNEEHDEWIRLLMPQNNKRVEVIDLDRNFWVISMVLSEICMYLFGEGSPYINLFKRTLNEIMQLWENTLYLWLALGMYCNTASSNIHIEFCSVPSSAQSHDRQYDYAYNNTSIGTIKERLHYLIDKYPKRILVVIPFIRSDFIGESKHQSITFPYLLWHFPFEEDYSYTRLKVNRGTDTTPSDVKILANKGRSDSNKILGLKDYLVGYRELGQKVIVSTDSLYDICNKYEHLIYRYDAAARIVPSIAVDTNGQLLKLKDFQFRIYDAVRQAVNNTETSPMILWLNGRVAEFNTDNSNDFLFNFGYSNKPTGTSFIETKLQKAFYTGECLTTFDRNKKITFDISTANVNLHPLGPDELVEIPGIGQLRNKDLSILSVRVKEDYKEQPDVAGKLYFILRTGEHDAGIHYGGDGSGQYSWIELDPNDNEKTATVSDILYIDKLNHKDVITKKQWEWLSPGPRVRPEQKIRDDYKLANHKTGNLGICAALYNPVIRGDNVLKYSKYTHYTEQGGTSFPSICEAIYPVQGDPITSHTYPFWNKCYYFLYRKLGDDDYTKDNWFIRQVWVSGAYTLPFKTGESIIQPTGTLITGANEENIFRYYNRTHSTMIKEDQVVKWMANERYVEFNFLKEAGVEMKLKPNFRTDQEYKVQWIKTGSQDKRKLLTYYPIVYKVEVALFGPNNEFESAVYRRREGLYGSDVRFLGTGENLSDWQMGQGTEVTKGFASLRRKLSEQYVLQVSEGKYKKYGTKDLPDFEANKRDGLVKTTKNKNESEMSKVNVEPMDTLPFDT